MKKYKHLIATATLLSIVVCFAWACSGKSTASTLLGGNEEQQKEQNAVRQAPEANGTELTEAIRSGDLNKVESLLKTGNDVNENSGEPLRIAISINRLDIVDQLILSGADVNLADEKGFTPLMHAAGVSPELVATLLQRGADPKTTDPTEGLNALMIACAKGNLKTVRLLLDSGCNPNSMTVDHNTPMMAAAYNCQDSIVQYLIQVGADVNAQGDSGSTALLYSAMGGCPDTTKTLLLQGADLSQQMGTGEYPLHLAVKSGKLSVVEVLVTSGADINQKDSMKMTPLMYAASGGYPDIVKYLLEKGADPKIKGPRNISARDLANGNNSEKILKLLPSD